MIQMVIEYPLQSLQTIKAKFTANIPDDCCIICAKKIKGEPKHFVHLLTNGNIVSSDESFSNSQGFFPVGSDCAKKLVVKFNF